MNSHRSLSVSSRFTTARISALLGFFTLAQAAGCDDSPQHQAGLQGGRAMINLGIIPENVACVRVTADSDARTVVRDFEVKAGDTVSDTLTGLPIGSVSFSAAAYTQDCASVTKSTVPTWISDAKTVTLAEGKSASVTLTLYRNGRAKVTVEFADQDAGAGAGAGTDARLSRDSAAARD